MEPNKIRITLELEDKKFVFEVPEDLDAYEMVDVLKLKAQLVILTFHSLEDRIVKQTFNKLAKI